VSSVTPTGFGMPSLTYLGIDVLRLPFIRTTSLGHEILHNWWGNGVYADYAHGNWAEGLTTFMADYAYRERKGPADARAARLEWLRDFAVLPASEDRPLTQFVSRDHDSAQIVGYGKAAMVFFMLRDMIGTADFDAGVRALWQSFRFREASWDDLRRIFERTSGRALGDFFSQWVQRAGAPALHIVCATSSPAAADRLHVTLSQDAPPYRLRVPLAIDDGRQTQRQVVELNGEAGTFEVAAGPAPRAVELDPDLRLFRRLEASEVPPILRRMMVDPQTRIVLAGAAPDAHAAATALAQALMEAPRFDDAAAPVPGASLVVIGLTADVEHWLADHAQPTLPSALLQKGDALAWSASLDGGGELVSIAARDAHALDMLARPLPHYGRRSFVVFEQGRQIDSGLREMPPQRLLVGTQSCGASPDRPPASAQPSGPR
jgi:hypothetical protein